MGVRAFGQLLEDGGGEASLGASEGQEVSEAAAPRAKFLNFLLQVLKANFDSLDPRGCAQNNFRANFLCRFIRLSENHH